MAVIVLAQHDRARDAALSLMRFFEHESCGQCTPCREGTMQAAHLMDAAAVGPAADGRAVGRDARRLDLRPRPGRAQPDGQRDPLLPA